MCEDEKFEDKLDGEKDAKKPEGEKNANSVPVRLCYDLDELTIALRLSRGSIYKMIKTGRLRPIKWFGRTLFRVQDVERLLDELAKEQRNKSDTMGFCTSTNHAWPWEFTGLHSGPPCGQSNWRPFRAFLAKVRSRFKSC